MCKNNNFLMFLHAFSSPGRLARVFLWIDRRFPLPPLFYLKGGGTLGVLMEQLLGNEDPKWNGDYAKNGAS